VDNDYKNDNTKYYYIFYILHSGFSSTLYSKILEGDISMDLEILCVLDAVSVSELNDDDSDKYEDSDNIDDDSDKYEDSDNIDDDSDKYEDSDNIDDDSDKYEDSDNIDDIVD